MAATLATWRALERRLQSPSWPRSVAGLHGRRRCDWLWSVGCRVASVPYRRRLCAGTWDGELLAVDLDSGEWRWMSGRGPLSPWSDLLGLVTGEPLGGMSVGKFAAECMAAGLAFDDWPGRIPSAIGQVALRAPDGRSVTADEYTRSLRGPRLESVTLAELIGGADPVAPDSAAVVLEQSPESAAPAVERPAESRPFVSMRVQPVRMSGRTKQRSLF